MSDYKLTTKNFERYLDLLSLRKHNPDLEYLRKLIESQIKRIPFENISKLYFKRKYNIESLIDFDLYLDGIERFGFGGTCYSINFYLNRLLSWLGYETRLCGADMKNPDVHLVNILEIKGEEFLVDLGYAAPFSEPIPLNQSYEYFIKCGSSRYVLEFQQNQPIIKLYKDGDLKHGYKVNPKPRNIDEFTQVIEDSFNEKATFMNALLLAIQDNDRFVIIRNMTITESSESTFDAQILKSHDQLANVINDRFSIPKEIIFESISGLKMDTSDWG